MFDFYKFTKEATSFKTQDDFAKYLESIYAELEEYLQNLSAKEIDSIKFEMEDLLHDLLDARLITKQNPKMINAFLLLLAQKFEQANLIGAITIIFDYLPECGIKKRLEASKLYLKVNDISKDYHERFHTILTLINASADEYEYRFRVVNSLLNFYLTAMSHFARVQNASLAQSFSKLFDEHKNRYELLNDPFVIETITKVTINNFQDIVGQIKEQLSTNAILSLTCRITKDESLSREKSNYSTQLYSLSNPTFTELREIAYNYVQNIGDPQEIYNLLSRGEAVINDERLLFKYIASFGAKHKAKLYDAFEKIIHKLQNERFNIIDWGCGQAFATMILLEFARERGITLDISHVTLIEPSKLALSRGLLHIDVFKQKEYAIKAINNDLDCLRAEDIAFENDYKTVHLFSNILDVESFRLDREFLQKISTSIVSDSLFVCVSPNINDKRNSRIDLFYKHFDENMNTSLISVRDSDIQGAKRYEKIFEVAFTKEQEVVEAREEFKEYHLDIYAKLNQYDWIIAPILDSNRVKESMEQDPDYIIFKIRKVTEVLTSKIYSKYQDNEEKVSQNDKIRYLSYEQKVLSRKAQSYLHTIRTIGNISVHEHIKNPVKMLKDDAYFLLSALILLVEEFLALELIVKE